MECARPQETPPNYRSTPRLPRHGGRPVIAGRTLPCGSGRLPPDFPRRLDRLKRASGLTWDQFAEALGMRPSRCCAGARAPSPAAAPTTN